VISKTVIIAAPDSLNAYLQKVWNHRSLIINLAKRDLKIKYAQTLLGLAWTVIQPLVAVLVYTLFFALLMDFQTAYPYVLFVLSGILLWNLFNYIFSQASSCLYQNQELIKKMAFPRIVLPLAKVLVGMGEFLIISGLFFLVFIFFKQSISWQILLVPIPVLLLILFSLGVALIMNALTLKNRDLNHLIPFLVNFGIWLTPVFYPISILPAQFENIIFLNPVTASLQLFRWCMFSDPLNVWVVTGLCLSFFTFIVGLFAFKKSENRIIELL